MKKLLSLAVLASLALNAHAMDNRIMTNDNIYVIDYIPWDIKVTDLKLTDKAKAMRDCQYADGQVGECVGYCSEQDSSCWVIRYLPSGAVERIYADFGNKLELWLKVGPDRSGKMTFVSARAAKFVAERQVVNAPARAECNPYNGNVYKQCDRWAPAAAPRPAPVKKATPRSSCGPAWQAWHQAHAKCQGQGSLLEFSCISNLGLEPNCN